MALQDFYEDLVFMEKKEISDGQGGFKTTYTDGAEFQGAIATNTSTQTRIAEQQGVTALYTITTDRNIELNFHNIIKRKSENQIFRVTSNSKDMQTPEMAELDFWQVTAKKWSLV